MSEKVLSFSFNKVIMTFLHVTIVFLSKCNKKKMTQSNNLMVDDLGFLNKANK